LARHQHFYMGSTRIGGFASLLMFLLGLTTFALLIKGAQLRKYFFPKGSFLIGDGEARYKRMVERRRHFGIGTLVTFALGILTSWVANLLSSH
jgi:hypothetical protein